MLKVIAATAAGAAVSGTGIESVLAASTPNPNSGGLQPGGLAPNVAFGTTPGVTYLWLWALTDFTSNDSTQAWARTTFGVQGSGFLWARPDLPHGAALTELTVSLVNTDGVADQIQFAQIFPWSESAPLLHAMSVTSASAAPQNITVPIAAPMLIDNSQFNFIVLWQPGISNSPTHRLLGARFGWINNPGLTLFPNPRRIVSSNMVSGTTYGPLNALLESDGVTPSGIPVGAKAAFCAVQSFTPGVLTIFPDLTTDPAIANYSGTGNMGTSLNMLYMMVPLSTAGKFKIHSYITGGVYLDAWGYLV